MSLHIADYGRGLPDGFPHNIYNLFDEPPEGAIVGARIKDYSRMLGVTLVRFGTISVTANEGHGLIFDATQKTMNGTTADGGKRGAKELTVTVASSDTVAKDDFARGTCLVLSGGLAPRSIYITGNAAKDSNNKVKITFEDALPSNFGTSDNVVLIAHKYMNVTVGTADHEVSAGASLTRSPASNKYAYLQNGGLGVAVASADIAANAQDGTPLVKAAAGKLALQADTNLKNVVATLKREGTAIDVSAQDRIPVEFSGQFDF